MAQWWETPSLRASNEGLQLDGYTLSDLAIQHGTPLYVYSRATIQRRLQQLQETLSAAVNHTKIYYAMKANRHTDVLRTMLDMPGVGIDTCSPQEVERALAHGFLPEDISFNAGMLSNHDLEMLAAMGVHCTLDSFSALRRYGALVPQGTAVGLRFDPGVRASYRHNPRTTYGVAKFGFEPTACDEAVQAATQAGLVVDSIHMHIGWGIPEEAAPLMDEAFGRLAELTQRIPGLRQVNIGGGLGGRFQESDQPLHLQTWGELIQRHFAKLDLTIACEPGTFVVAAAGVLLLEVNTVETRRNINWIGVNGGFPLNPCPALYDIPLAVVSVSQSDAPYQERYHVAGHINEAGDIWVRNQMLPAVQEGDLLAFVPAGAYGSSMASNHCMRGSFHELMV